MSWVVLICAGLLLSVLVVCEYVILSRMVSAVKVKFVCRTVLLLDVHHN